MTRQREQIPPTHQPYSRNAHVKQERQRFRRFKRFYYAHEGGMIATFYLVWLMGVPLAAAVIIPRVIHDQETAGIVMVCTLGIVFFVWAVYTEKTCGSGDCGEP